MFAGCFLVRRILRGGTDRICQCEQKVENGNGVEQTTARRGAALLQDKLRRKGVPPEHKEAPEISPAPLTNGSDGERALVLFLLLLLFPLFLDVFLRRFRFALRGFVSHGVNTPSNRPQTRMARDRFRIHRPPSPRLHTRRPPGIRQASLNRRTPAPAALAGPCNRTTGAGRPLLRNTVRSGKTSPRLFDDLRKPAAASAPVTAARTKRIRLLQHNRGKAR